MEYMDFAWHGVWRLHLRESGKTSRLGYGSVNGNACEVARLVFQVIGCSHLL
jgi:hypothetical protein